MEDNESMTGIAAVVFMGTKAGIELDVVGVGAGELLLSIGT